MSLTMASKEESWTPFHGVVQWETRNKTENGSSGNFSSEARPYARAARCDHRQGYRLFLGARTGWQCAEATGVRQTHVLHEIGAPMGVCTSCRSVIRAIVAVERSRRQLFGSTVTAVDAQSL